MDVKEIRIEDFDYPLDDNRIAKYPLAERDTSNLLYWKQGIINKYHFYNLPELLEEGDSFVLPDDKHNFNEWKLKFDKALKWTMDDVDDYLGELGFGLQLQIKTDYSFSAGNSKWLAAYCKREHDVTEDGVIMIALISSALRSCGRYFSSKDFSYSIVSTSSVLPTFL